MHNGFLEFRRDKRAASQSQPELSLIRVLAQWALASAIVQQRRKRAKLWAIICWVANARLSFRMRHFWRPSVAEYFIRHHIPPPGGVGHSFVAYSVRRPAVSSWVWCHSQSSSLSITPSRTGSTFWFAKFILGCYYGGYIVTTKTQIRIMIKLNFCSVMNREINLNQNELYPSFRFNCSGCAGKLNNSRVALHDHRC